MSLAKGLEGCKKLQISRRSLIIFFLSISFLFFSLLYFLKISLSQPQRPPGQPQPNGGGEGSYTYFPIKLFAGWNFISIPFYDGEIAYSLSDCYFLYNRGRHYLPNGTLMIINLEPDDRKVTQIGAITFGIYSYTSCTLQVRGQIPFRPSSLELKKGKNFIATPYNGLEVSKVSGSEIDAIVYFNSSEKRWYKLENRWGRIYRYVYNPITKKWEIKEENLTSFLIPPGTGIYISARNDCKVQLA
ncbi:MAG: hypothetical protein LM587_01925 [Candidatus Aenigmarchaeota archaeon]|nr:hypothetical protein [Candidatus Aenigmarchaeota archaeon]